MTERPTSQEVRIELGRLVRRSREAARLDIAATAHLSGLSPAEIEAIEQGVNPDPLMFDLNRLEQAFGVRPGCFFDLVKWTRPTSGDPGGYVWVNRVDDA